MRVAPVLRLWVLAGKKLYVLLLRNGDHVKRHVVVIDLNQAVTMATSMLK